MFGVIYQLTSGCTALELIEQVTVVLFPARSRGFSSSVVSITIIPRGKEAVG
jgi:hypothetical protein